MLQLGDRVKLIRGDADFYDKGKHAPCGKWIAGDIPVGSTGIIALAKEHYRCASHRSFSWCILWDHNPVPKEGFYWGVSQDSLNLDTIQ